MTCATCWTTATPPAVLAVDYFVYRAARELGGLAAVLGGVDGIVFTAGIGENSAEVRRRMCTASAWLGVELDATANATGGPRITRKGSKVSAWVIPDERGTDDRPAHAGRARAWRGPPRCGPEDTKMAATAPKKDTPDNAAPWNEFHSGLWQSEINVRDFIQQNYTPYDGDESFLAAATERTQKIWKKLEALFVEERKKSVLDVSQIPSSITAHKPGYIDRDNEVIVGLQTDAPLKRAIMPNGGFRLVANALKTYGYDGRSTGRGGLHEVSQDAQRCRLRRIHGGHPPLSQFAHPDRSSRRLRPWTHHRRLPSRTAVRRGPADPAQAGGKELAGHCHVDRRNHPRPRGTFRAAARARGTEADGVGVWLRCVPARRNRKRSGPVAVFRLPGRRQGAERRRHVARPGVDLPRYLPAAGSRRRHDRRNRSAGDDRRFRHQAAYRALPAHAGIRRLVCRRPDLGDRIHRRHGRRRARARHAHQLPLPADALYPGTRRPSRT